MYTSLKFLTLFLTALLCGGIVSSAADQPQFVVPTLTGPVVDTARMLNSQDLQAISDYLRDLNAHGKVQLQVLIVDSLMNEPIEQASIKIVDQWKLGRAKADNGVLLLISKQDRKMRIEVGRGLEGDLPDVWAKRIIDDDIRPEFKQGRYAEGVMAGLASIVSHVDPEYSSSIQSQNRYHQPNAEPVQLSKWQMFKGLLWLLFIFYFVFLNPRTRGIAWLWMLFGGGGGGGGSWGGGGSSGGSWGGGGGGFSGGGASGDW